MIGLLGAWTCLFAAYLLLAGAVSADEIVAGTLCATAAVLWWAGTRRVSAHAFTFEAGTWAAAGRGGRKLPRATLAVAATLWRALRHREGGVLATLFFAHGGRADQRDAGRRAIAVLAASLAPDSFVLRTPSGRDEAIVHSLSVAKPPENPRWLI